MVLRKPYAFLIKHFKLIHLIITVLMLFLIFQTNTLLNFFNNVIASSQIVIGTNVIDNLFSNYMYLASAGVLLFATVIFILMSFKEKPKLYYGMTIVGYILLIVLYSYSIKTIGTMQKELVDERVIRAVRDFLNIMFIFQIYTLVISFVRTIGLDVKKFDFKDDFSGLGLDDSDNEEFEVNVNFDAAKLKRKFRREYRNIRYYFAENKFMLIAIVIIVVLVGSFFLYRGLRDDTRECYMGQPFNPVGYNMIIQNAYETSQDYQFNNIAPEGKTLVVIKFKIKTTNKTEKFIFGKLALKIGDTKYYHNTKYKDLVSDLGTSYVAQALTDSYQDFVLVYEVPAELKNKKMNLIYTEQLVSGMFKTKTDDIRIPLLVTNLDIKKDPESININQSYIIGEGLLKDYTLKMISFDMNNSFNINYDVCVSSEECYTYYEYLMPSLSGISDKALLKLKMDLSIPDDGNIKNVGNLITSFGYIQYALGDKINTQKIVKKLETTHKDGNYYFEIKREIMDADSVSLIIRARNYNYQFKLK